VYAEDGREEFWEAGETTGSGASAVRRLQPVKNVDPAMAAMPEVQLNNARGPLLQWESTNRVSAMIPPGVGAASPVSIGMRTGLHSPAVAASIVVYARPSIE